MDSRQREYSRPMPKPMEPRPTSKVTMKVNVLETLSEVKISAEMTGAPLAKAPIMDRAMVAVPWSLVCIPLGADTFGGKPASAVGVIGGQGDT